MASKLYVYVYYPIECREENREEIIVSPVVRFELPNGEVVELKYPEGLITSSEKELGAISCPVTTLVYKESNYTIGFCPNGGLKGYETVIFDKIKRSIYAQVKSQLAKIGLKRARFTPCGYGKIAVEII